MKSLTLMRPTLCQACLHLTVTALALIASGCRMHGDGAPPKVDLPPQWPAAHVSGPSRDLPSDAWWHQLGSPELNGLVDEGLQKNRQAQIALNSIQQAQAQLDTIRLGWLPSLNFFAGVIEGNTTLFFQDMPIPVTNVGGFVGFLPTYIINLFQHGALNLQAEKALEVSQAEYLAVRVALIAQITTSYSTLLATERQGEILEDLRNNLQTRATLADSMAKRGLDARLKPNELLSELHLLEGQVALNEANRQSAQNALLVLVGRPIGRIKPASSLAKLTTASLAPGNTPAAVIAARPDVVAARARLDAMNYGATAAATALLPSINLNALMTNIKASTNEDSNSTSANFQAAFANWVLAPEMVGAINSSDARYSAAALAYVEAVNRALQEADDALASYSALSRKLEADTEAGKKMGENLALSRSMYSRGLLAREQYLDVQAENDLVQAAIAQTKASQLIMLAKLYQSMGGGSLHGEKALSISDGAVVKTEK